MKGVIQEDHIPLNKFILSVSGIGVDLIFTAVSGIEEELDVAEMPDRTVATGGRTKPVEFTCMLPLHHEVEQKAMEEWYAQTHGDGRSPNVDLAYKRTGTLRLPSISGAIQVTFVLDELFPSGRALPDFEMENEGEMAQVEWKFRASDIRKTS